MRIYLDHAATTPCDPRVVEAMRPYFSESFGNASSPHAEGGRAQEAIGDARDKVANLIGAKPQEIVFTSGGTESDNMVLKGVALARKQRGNHIITSAVEHHAVLESCASLEKQGFQVTYLPVDRYGTVDPAEVERAMTDKTVLISIMHANNEVGTVQPIEEIGQLARTHEVYFHTDAVQTVGSLPIDVGKLSIDFLSMSAHKLYGPKGVGALYIRSGVMCEPLIHGGSQESRRRASTENVPGIVGFGKAAHLAMQCMGSEARRESKLRDMLMAGILERVDHVRLNGHPTKRLPNNVNVSVRFVEGESMTLHLDAAGIACSTGSACSSSDLTPSHVLLAMGLSHEIAHGSLRFSLGRSTKRKDIEQVLEVLPAVVGTLRSMSPLMRSNENVHA